MEGKSLGGLRDRDGELGRGRCGKKRYGKGMEGMIWGRKGQAVERYCEMLSEIEVQGARQKKVKREIAMKEEGGMEGV